MFPDRLRELSPAGWLLALLSAVAIVAVAWAVGAWGLEAIGRSALRRYLPVFVFLLALPGFGAGVAFWMTGARILRACGIDTNRAREGPRRQFR